MFQPLSGSKMEALRPFSCPWPRQPYDTVTESPGTIGKGQLNGLIVSIFELLKG